MTPELAAAVEHAYRVFARYTLGDDLIVCRCNVCVDSPETERVLVSTPLRELAAEWLAEYTNSAHGYDEGRIADELRHFLPRYFDLIALGASPCHIGLAYALTRLGEADYRTHWPAAEAAAIDAFFAALFSDRVRRDAIAPEAWVIGPALVEPVEEILELIAAAGGDVARLLRSWDETEDPAGALQAAQLAEEWEEALTGQRPASEVWGSRAQESWALVAGWLRRSQTAARVERALQSAADESQRAILARGLVVLAAPSRPREDVPPPGDGAPPDRPHRAAEAGRGGGGRGGGGGAFRGARARPTAPAGVSRGRRTSDREMPVPVTVPSARPGRRAARPAGRTCRPAHRLPRCRRRRGPPSTGTARAGPPASCRPLPRRSPW